MNARCIKIAFTALLLASSACFRAEAQRMNCTGIVQSYSRMGFYYERETKDRSFMSCSICAETAEMFSGKTSLPGLSASFGWNFIFAEAERQDGSRIVFFAGPGATAGVCRDFKSPPGFFFGMQGRAGVCLQSKRNVDISVCAAPVLGIHSVRDDESTHMKYFRYGLMRAVIPEIRIGYRF